jgi:hypothetical protein
MAEKGQIFEPCASPSAARSDNCDETRLVISSSVVQHSEIRNAMKK